MDEQDEIFQAGDQAVRAGLMALGRAGETIAQLSQRRDREGREAAEAAARRAERARSEAEHKQTDTVRLSHQQVSRDSWWAGADGNRVATQLAFVELSSQDPRAADAAAIMRERMRSIYGLDVDAIDAAHPTSATDRHTAIANAIDDWRAAQREDALAEEDREKAAEHEAAATEAGVDGDKADRDKDAAVEASAAAEEHEEAADDLRSDAAAEERQAAGYEAETRSDYRAGVDAAAAAATPGDKAKAESSAGYPKSAKQSVTESRTKGAPRARVNRRRQVKAGSELTR
jgi:hypothetical protein